MKMAVLKMKEVDVLLLVLLLVNLKHTQLSYCSDTLQSALLKNDRDIEMLKETIDSITLELTFNKEHSIKLAQELVETQDVSNKNEVSPLCVTPNKLGGGGAL